MTQHSVVEDICSVVVQVLPLVLKVSCPVPSLVARTHFQMWNAERLVQYKAHLSKQKTSTALCLMCILSLTRLNSMHCDAYLFGQQKQSRQLWNQQRLCLISLYCTTPVHIHIETLRGTLYAVHFTRHSGAPVKRTVQINQMILSLEIWKTLHVLLKLHPKSPFIVCSYNYDQEWWLWVSVEAKNGSLPLPTYFNAVVFWSI